MTAKLYAGVSFSTHLLPNPRVFGTNNHNFDWDRMTSFEGDTGPYLQYAHVRLTSLTRDAQEPRAFAATAAEADRSRDAHGATGRARDRVFAGHVPGCCADGAAHARAERGGRTHGRVPACACDLERVGDCRGPWSRARRMSSGLVRGCGFICVRGTCSGLQCSCSALSIRPLECM